MELVAYHNDNKVKAKYVSRVKAHAKADQIIKGRYWENGKGCAVGCTVHSSSHAAYENELGIPRALARIEDGIFEGLPNEIAKDFPLRFLSAVKVGSDLSGVIDKFMHWILVDPVDGIVKFAKKERSIKSIKDVGELYARKIAGEVISIATWRAAYAAAYAAADAAADAYAYAAAYAASDAYAAADAAAYAAADAAADAAVAGAVAAYAAADADAYAAAAAASYADRQQTRVRQADKLIELIEAAPMAVSVNVA